MNRRILWTVTIHRDKIEEYNILFENEKDNFQKPDMPLKKNKKAAQMKK